MGRTGQAHRCVRTQPKHFDDQGTIIPRCCVAIWLGKGARGREAVFHIREEHLQIVGQALAFKAWPQAAEILFQGHCHQRALVGNGPAIKLLRRIPGAEVVDLDAGCCGMAGSFGYEKEHYEISRLVGEQRLFPALRAAAANDVIVAPGFSCRLQIEHFTGRKAVHPAELLAEQWTND